MSLIEVWWILPVRRGHSKSKGDSTGHQMQLEKMRLIRFWTGAFGGLHAPIYGKKSIKSRYYCQICQWCVCRGLKGRIGQKMLTATTGNAIIKTLLYLFLLITGGDQPSTRVSRCNDADPSHVVTVKVVGVGRHGNSHSSGGRGPAVISLPGVGAERHDALRKHHNPIISALVPLKDRGECVLYQGTGDLRRPLVALTASRCLIADWRP